MLEGDEEFLIHLVGKKQFNGLRQFWNHSWNIKLGENVSFFNGTLSQTLANNFYLKEYIELSANGHCLLTPRSKKFFLFFASKSGSRSSTDNRYHPLLCRLDFIIQYALFRRMILIQEYRFYQSLLASVSHSSTNSYPTDSLNGSDSEKDKRREVLSCDDMRVRNRGSSNTRWPLWLRSPSKRSREKSNNNDNISKKDAERSERDLHRMTYHSSNEAWRICGTPSWLLSLERCTQQDRVVRHRFFCLPLSYFPVESVMPHLADWLYDDALEKMLPIWKRLAQACLMKCSHTCCRRMELCKNEEKEEREGDWLRKRGSGRRRGSPAHMLYHGQALAAHSVVYFWFYRYASTLLERQLQSAEGDANRFYQERVHDGSFRFVTSFFHFPKPIRRRDVQRWDTPHDTGENRPMKEEEKEKLPPRRRQQQRKQTCMDPHSSFSSPFAFSSFFTPASSSMGMMKERPSRVRTLLFLEGFMTCGITFLDLFSSRVFADVSILSAAVAMTGRFSSRMGEENAHRKEETERHQSQWRGGPEEDDGKDGSDVLFSFSTKVFWSLLSSVAGVLLRGVRREITRQLAKMLSEDLEDHIASVLISADHAFLDRLFTFEGGGGGGGPRGFASSSFSSGPRSSPYRFHGRGLYTPSARGVVRRVGGAGEALVTQWDTSIRRWATAASLLFHAFYCRDWRSVWLAFAFASLRHKNMVGKIAVRCGFAMNTSSWIWLREQSPPFHRTHFGLTLLLDVLSEKVGETPTKTPLLDECALPGVAAQDNGGGGAVEEEEAEVPFISTTTRISDAFFHATTTRRTEKRPPMRRVPFPVLSLLVCSDIWRIPECFLSTSSSSSSCRRDNEGEATDDDDGRAHVEREDKKHRPPRDAFASHLAEDPHPPSFLPWSRGERWLRFYTLLASPSTISCADQQAVWRTEEVEASMMAMQEMVACIKEEVIRPAVPHRQWRGPPLQRSEENQRRDAVEETTAPSVTTGTAIPSWRGSAPRVPPPDPSSSSASSSLLSGRQEHVYDLDPEEHAIVQHPGALECLPYAGSGGAFRHFQPGSFFLLKQLGLESVMTCKAWMEKVKEEDENDGVGGDRGGGGGPLHDFPTPSSTSLGSWWRWWWGRLGLHADGLFAHDGHSNPFVGLLWQCVELGEVVLLAGCTCIRVRSRRPPPPPFSSSGAEAEGTGETTTTREGKEEEASPIGRGRWVPFSAALLHVCRLLRISSPFSRVEWYTECTPHAASLLLKRYERVEMYQRVISSSLRKSPLQHTRYLSGIYELLHHLPSTMADDSPRGKSVEMTRRRLLWRRYLSSLSTFSSLRFNAQHYITGGLTLSQGIRFHDVSFLYPQLHYEGGAAHLDGATCASSSSSSASFSSSSSSLGDEDEENEAFDAEMTTVETNKVERATMEKPHQDVHGDDSGMPPPLLASTHTINATSSQCDNTPAWIEDEKGSNIQNATGKAVYGATVVAPILSNASMFFPSSGMSAVMGRTGAGKSTVCHVLTRVYDPTPEVWVDVKADPSTTPMKKERRTTTETSRASPSSAAPSAEEAEDEGERLPSRRLPWSRELAADIVFQLFSHTIPLPPSSSSSSSASSSCPACSDERDAYTVGIPQPGYVSFDAIPAACFSLGYLRQWLLPMEQTPTILPQRTFEENIRFTNAEVRRADVAWAAAVCQCMPFIQKTPLQLQQPIQAVLSGGETQRLGLARVFAAAGARMRAYRLSHAYYHADGTMPQPQMGGGAATIPSLSFSPPQHAMDERPSRPKEEEEDTDRRRRSPLGAASWSSSFSSSPPPSPSTLRVPAAGHHTEGDTIHDACKTAPLSATVVLPSSTFSSSTWRPSPPPPCDPTVAVTGVLLDEPTSRLDAVHERKIEEALRSLFLPASSSSSSSTSSLLSSPVSRRWSAMRMTAEGRLLPSPAPSCMVVVVAHRLSTIQAASHIIVLADGKVESEGTPQEVFRTSLFARKQLSLQSVPPDRQ